MQGIAGIADEVRQLVPQARVAIGHGQMKERQLEAVMHRFLQREIDVLVCTTIIESGLDIPNANTIIIRNADKFGLAELYQLRGRVGRSSRRAYAYLLVSDFRTLGPDAQKRLKVLESLDDLGVGFRLALQDMEIRGAGNLLGKDQSGHVELVGFDLYSRILKEAVRELAAKDSLLGEKAARVKPTVDPEMRIGFPAHIPTYYIPDVEERLLLYQRLVELRDAAHGHELAEEIEDRFGKLPEEVEQLVDLMIFRSLMRDAGVVSAQFRAPALSLVFHQDMTLDPERIVATLTKHHGAVRLSPQKALHARLDGTAILNPADLYRYTQRLFRELGLCG